MRRCLSTFLFRRNLVICLELSYSVSLSVLIVVANICETCGDILLNFSDLRDVEMELLKARF